MPSLSFFPSKCFFVNCTVFTYDDVRTYGSMPRIQLSLKICRFPYDGLSAILYFFPPPPPPMITNGRDYHASHGHHSDS